MRVLIISLFSHMPHHLGTELEIIQEHLDAGDDVSVLACNGELPACLGNIAGTASRCRSCISARYIGLRALRNVPPIHVLNDYYNEHDRANESTLKTTFRSDAEIRDYVVDGLDAGYAALSSTVWEYRDPFLETDQSRRLLGRMIVSSYRVYCSVKNFLRQERRFDRAYIFNGRFATSRGAFRACEQMKTDVYLHERGSTNDKYMLYENSLPHDRKQMFQRIQSMWLASTDEEKLLGDAFYRNRRNRVESLWYSFTKEQQKGKLPKGWDSRSRNVVVFTSSEDEFVSIGKEWENPAFHSQTQAIVDLNADLISSSDDIELYVRMHPNLKSVDNQDTRRQRSLTSPRLHIIPPESDVCSYAMLEQSEKIISFGSTMGIEAAYWGKPSILAGISFYGELGSTYGVSGRKELFEMARTELAPLPNDGARKYGLYMSTFGKPFHFYKAVDFKYGYFRGVCLRKPVPFAPYRVVIPHIQKLLGTKAFVRNTVERTSYAVGYVPFRVAHDILRTLRNLTRDSWRKYSRSPGPF